MDKVKVSNSNFHESNVNIAGYKHAAVSIIASSVYLTTKIKIKNIPMLEDTFILSDILKSLGADVLFKNNTMLIDSSALSGYEIPQSLNEKIHGSLYLIPTILGRTGKVKIGPSGGCQIGDMQSNGARPIQHIVSVLQKFGAHFQLENNNLIGYCKGFDPCTIDIMDYSDSKEILTGPLVSGATKTAILAAVCTKMGTTVIHNPYFKPDVTELLDFLSLVGYEIKADENSIHVTPPNAFKEATHYLISDITEIMTYISCSIYMKHALTLNNITIDRVKKALKPEIEYLNQMNINLEWEENCIRIPHVEKIKSVDIDVTSMGIYSDSHPFFSLMLLRGDRESRITEHVWHHRFNYAEQLKKLDLNLEVVQNTVYITPGNPSNSSLLEASDLRSAAVLLLASLKSPGTTTITNVHHLKRGYEDFIGKLKNLGAKIETISTKTLIRK